MGKFTLQQHIDAPLAEVFAIATDFALAAERIRGIVRMEMLTDGPIGIGTRVRETRMMFGKEAIEELELTEFDPPHRFTLECETCGALFSTRHKFQPVAGGTMLELEVNCRAVTLLAKLMTPLSWLMMGSMKKCIQGDLEDLKEAAEAGIPKQR